MAPRFRQISPFDGVDEGNGPLDASIIVPVNGSSLVFLEGGPHLQVTSDSPSVIPNPTEIKSASSANLPAANVAFVDAALRSRAKRLFRVSAKYHLAGKQGVAISAKNRNGTEARLHAIVLKPKPMIVSLREIHVWTDDTRKKTAKLSQEKFDQQAMLDHMNMVWANQANIIWTLGNGGTPALIDEIDIRSGGPNHDNDVQNRALSAKCDKDANLTIFFSRKAFDPQHAKTSAPWTFPVNGYTDAELGFCVVADGHLDFTIEHEEGHFLGALDASGKFVADYGHSSEKNIMNVGGVSNGIIPASMATVFNKGFA